MSQILKFVLLEDLCMRYLLGLCAVLIVGTVNAEKPTVFGDKSSADHRLGELNTLNGFFLSKP